MPGLLETVLVNRRPAQRGVLRQMPVYADPHGFSIDMGRPVLRESDGSIATERSMTEKVGDRWYNFPTIWDGQELPPEQAFELFRRALASGVVFPNFASRAEAEYAAKLRSQRIGELRR